MRRFLIMSTRSVITLALLAIAIPTLGQVIVSCDGNGIPVPKGVTEPLQLEFGDVYFGYEAFDTFTVTNEGGGTLKGHAFRAETCSPWFSLFREGFPEADTLHFALLTDEAATYTVRFSPPADSAAVENPIPAHCDIVVEYELSLP